LLAVHATAAKEDERDQIDALCAAAQAETEESLELVYADQFYTGPRAAEAAAEHCIELEIIKLAEPKKVFVLLPRRSRRGAHNWLGSPVPTARARL
jgi:hypothetical protein